MVKLTGEIILIPNNIGQIESATINHKGNNFSADINSVVGVNKDGNNAFLIGASTLNGKSTFSGKLNYYSGSVLSNGQGVFGIPYELTINGIDITSVTIVFDTARNGYPASITVDNQIYDCISPYFTASNLTKANSHTIKISKWNLPKYPVVIQGIYADIKIALNDTNILSLSNKFMQQADIEQPSFGIISNTGRAEFIDNGDYILSLINQSLVDNATIKMYLENTLYNKKQLVGELKASEWNYDNNNKKVMVDLQDDLVEWQSILVKPVELSLTSTTLTSMYEYLLANTPKSFNMLISNRALSLINDVTLEHYYLEGDNLWNEWQKLCDVCGLYIYKNFQNNVIIDTFFNSNSYNSIIVPSNSIYDMDDNKVIKNQIRGISYNENQTNFVKKDMQEVAFYTDNQINDYNHFDSDLFTSSRGSKSVQYEDDKYFYKINPSIETYFLKQTIRIPKIQKNNRVLVDKVYAGADVEVTLIGKRIVSYKGMQPDETPQVTDYQGRITKFDVTVTAKSDDNKIIGTETASCENKEKFELVVDNNNPDYFKLNIIVATWQLADQSVGDILKNSIPSGKWFYKHKQVLIMGEKLQIKIFGEIYEFDIQNAEKSYKEKINYQLSTNELIQQNTTINNYTIGNWLCSNIYSRYKNGKEIAEILCQIGNYKENNSQDTIIDIKEPNKKMTFSIGDVVQPYVYKNKDMPMSLVNNGTPKDFKVVGIEVFYDGAIWQRLYLQEV